jgi:acetolactate synthase-1/2/3 large subunit
VHPLSAGLFGRYTRIANDLIAASDALIVVGYKLGEFSTMHSLAMRSTEVSWHLKAM